MTMAVGGTGHTAYSETHPGGGGESWYCAVWRSLWGREAEVKQQSLWALQDRWL